MIPRSIGIEFLLRAVESYKTDQFMQDNGINRSFFSIPEQKILDFIVGFVEKHLSTPPLSLINQANNTDFAPPEDTNIEFWAYEVKKRYLLAKVSKDKSKLDDLLNNSTATIENFRDFFHSNFIMCESYSGTPQITTLEAGIEKVIEHHEKVRLNKIATGIPFGFDYLNKVSGGAQGGDFIVISARPGVGKTYIMLHMALTAYDYGKNVLWVGTEMSDIQYASRITAMLSKQNPNSVRFGGLSSHAGMELVKASLDVVSEKTNKFMLLNASINNTIPKVMSSIRTLKPDIVFIDGAYLLKDPTLNKANRFEQVSTGAESFKAAARDLNIPVVATYQTKRQSRGEVDDIYQSDVVGQMASIAMYIKPEGDEVISTGWAGEQFKILKLTKGREGEYGTIRLRFDMINLTIEQVEVIQGKMFTDVLEEDDD